MKRNHFFIIILCFILFSLPTFSMNRIVCMSGGEKIVDSENFTISIEDFMSKSSQNVLYEYQVIDIKNGNFYKLGINSDIRCFVPKKYIKPSNFLRVKVNIFDNGQLIGTFFSKNVFSIRSGSKDIMDSLTTQKFNNNNNCETKEWDLYPNPTKDIVYLSNVEYLGNVTDLSINIFDLNGRELSKDKYYICVADTSKFLINLQNFQKGHYLIRINQKKYHIFKE